MRTAAAKPVAAPLLPPKAGMANMAGLPAAVGPAVAVATIAKVAMPRQATEAAKAEEMAFRAGKGWARR